MKAALEEDFKALRIAKAGNVNLKQLSQLLGLSQTTVSRALNGYPEVNAETRERVLDAVRRTGYRPNRAAQFSTTTIGWSCGAPSGSYTRNRRPSRLGW